MLMCGGSRRPRSHLAPRVQRSFRGSQRWESSGAPRRLWLEKTKSASGRRQYSEATISRRPAVQRPVTAADLGRVPAPGAEGLLGDRGGGRGPVPAFAPPFVTETQSRNTALKPTASLITFLSV